MKSIPFYCRKNVSLDDDAILNNRLRNLTPIAVAFRCCSTSCSATASAFAHSEIAIRRSVSLDFINCIRFFIGILWEL